MKPLIICIVGASGSGKTTASMILQKQFGWNAIVSYTTRPMRKGEINGKDHWFVKKDQVPPLNRMCAYTQFGGYEYWTEWNQFQTLFPSIYVIDEKGLVNLQSKIYSFPFDLVTIQIKRDNLQEIDDKRRERDNERICIPDEQYDYIVENNGSMEEFRTSLYLTAQCIIQKQ
nr:MAG TPA: Guanylate kinase [Caudoviricetes sp.]